MHEDSCLHYLEHCTNHFDYFQYDLLAHVLDNIPAMLQAAALDKFKDILQEQPVAVVAAEPT